MSDLNREQVAILDHTIYRAANGLYCGGGSEMRSLVELGLMVCVGYKSFVPDGYFRITEAGRDAWREQAAAKAAEVK